MGTTGTRSVGRPRVRRLVALAAMLVAGALVGSACAAARVPPVDNVATVEPGSLPEASTTTSAGPSTTAEPLVVPEQLRGFDTRTLAIVDGSITYVLAVAVADAPSERSQGLMNVADLGDLDGMLFVWEQPTAQTFWMKDTLLPLDIAFFDATGSYVDSFSMEPCVAEPCDSYQPAGSYTHAIEVPQTGFAALTSGAKLVLDG